MFGAIVHQEMLLGSRRNRLYLFRWIYAAWLILQLFWFYVEFQQQKSAAVRPRWNQWGMPIEEPPPALEPSAPQIVGGRFAEAFVWQQLLLLVLAVPALVAGAVTDEKRRGTLLYLLSAGVDSRDILLGKLFGRMAIVLAVALTGLPLFALMGGLCGIDLLTIFLLGVQLLLSLFALASAALLASVLSRQTRDAVLGLYLVGLAGWFAIYWFGGVLNYFNPLYVIAPVWEQGSRFDSSLVLGRLLGSVVAWGLVGGSCLALAIWLLRPLYRRELESLAPVHRWYSTERAGVEDDPVRWRELHVEGLSPFRTFRTVPQWLAIRAIVTATTLSSLTILWLSLPVSATWSGLAGAVGHLDWYRLGLLMPDSDLGFLIQNLVVLLLASLIVGIRCSGAITGEREKQTWEALLMTPLSAKQLVRSKLWGVMGASYAYLLAYAGPAVALSALGGWLALCWTVLGVAVTVLAMYFIGAAGIYCSVRCKNSWRSLLGTMGFGYLGGLALYGIASPVILVLAGLLMVVVTLADLILQTHVSSVARAGFNVWWNLFFVSSCVGLGVIFLLMARLFLNRAQRYIADRERTRHWSEEPIYRRPRRPLPLKQPAWEE